MELKEKTTIVEQYKKFLELLGKSENRTIPTLFKKFKTFIETQYNEGLDKELYWIVWNGLVSHSIEECIKRDLRLKDFSLAWSSQSTEQCYQLVKKLSLLAKQGEGQSDQYKILTYQLQKLMKETDDAALQLYLYQVHKNSRDGEGLYNSELAREKLLLQCNTNEEIETLLHKELTPTLQENKLKAQAAIVESARNTNNTKTETEKLDAYFKGTVTLTEEEEQREFEKLKSKYFKRIESEVTQDNFKTMQGELLDSINGEDTSYNVKRRVRNVTKAKLNRLMWDFCTK